MRKFILLISAACFLGANGFAAQGQARGELQVTAVVQSSATWVQGANGVWSFVLANAPGTSNTVSALQQYKKANSSVDVNLSKTVSNSTPCHTHKVHGRLNTGRCSQ
jgi:hypothetical protein